MKKLFVAIFALCAMAVSFISCDKKADPVKEPIAGKTFKYVNPADEDVYVQFTFHMDHKVTNEVRDEEGNSVTQTALEWEMESNAKDFVIKWAAGAVNLETGTNVGGVIIYKGVYDAAGSKITVTMQGVKDLVQYVCTEVK